MKAKLRDWNMAKAFVLMNCETGSEDSIISKLKLLDHVKEAHGTFGSYDIITKLEADTEGKIQQTISKKIRQINKIRATLTLIAQNGVRFRKKISDIEKEVLDKYTTQAYVIIKCKKGQEENVLQNLSTIPEVIENDLTIGAYGIINKIVAPTYNDISDIITKKIRRLKNIKETFTLNIIPEQYR